MNTYLYLEVDLAGLAILLIILIYGKLHGNGQMEQRVFNALSVSSAVLLLTDWVMWALEGTQNRFASALMHAATFFFHIVAALIVSLWLMYCDCQLISGGNAALRRKLYLLPWLAVTALALVNLKTGMIYYFDQDNMYFRGNVYGVFVLINGIGIAYSALMVLHGARHFNGVRRRDAYSLLLFALPPVAGVTVQTLFYGTNMIPISIAVALLVIFIQRHSALITMDNLTGLNNYRVFERYMEYKMHTTSSDQKLFLIFMDADRFKHINDSFGHAAGNAALVKIATVLQQTCAKSDCLARVGGDEFVIAGQRRTEDEVQALCRTVDQAIARENREGGNPYQISLSMGCALYDPSVHRDTNDFLHAADQQMYRTKKARRETLQSV